jgi:hypothetical protein
MTSTDGGAIRRRIHRNEGGKHVEGEKMVSLWGLGTRAKTVERPLNQALN